METYKDQAEALYNRIENKTGAKPTQKDVKEYLGENYVGSVEQDNFIQLITSVRSFGDKRRTHIKWTEEEEKEIIDLYNKYGKKKVATQVNYMLKSFRGRHTKQAIAKKRQRILAKL